jgi:type III pantothenate kinase
LFSAKTACGIGLDYPRPQTIGADRLANALAARTHYGAPVVAVDFGTATTFDVVNAAGAFIGGAIAPGPRLMTAYLHETTALLPAVPMCPIQTAIGRTTRQAIQAGAWHGYCGLVSQLIRKIKHELECPSLPVIATGGGASLVASGSPEITAVEPDLTLEGLRLCWLAHHPDRSCRQSQSKGSPSS